MIPDKIIKASFKGVSKIYFMPAEGYGLDNEYEVMYPDSDIYDSISAIYFWGKIPYNWFKNNRRINNINHLKITGYNRFPIAKAYREINIKNKSRIGFIGRFPASNDIYKRSIMWFFLIENSNEDIDKILFRSQTVTKAVWFYSRVFNEIIKNSNYIISYRPHPNEDIETYKILSEKFGERFELNFDYDIAEWASKCHKIVGLASTSFIDSSMTMTPVISIDKLIDTTTQTEKFDPILKSVYSSSHNPNNELIFKLLFDKHLSIIKTKEFEKVIKNNFEGRAVLFLIQL